MTTSAKRFGDWLIKFLSGLLKSIWLFFPGILFLLLTMVCFWLKGQGKDIMVAFIEEQTRYYSRFIFFLAASFWVYVSWYSSRIIAYIKQSGQVDKVQDLTGKTRLASEDEFINQKKYVDISKGFLDEFPRIIGNACCLILELGSLQSPVLSSPLSATAAVIIFTIGLIVLRFLNRWITKTQAMRSWFRTVFYVLLFILLALTMVASLLRNEISIYNLFGLLLLLHAVFIFYINLRRAEMDEKAATVKAATDMQERTHRPRSFFEAVMDYFCLPRREAGYFKSFLIVASLGIFFYVLAIYLLGFARGLGPFPFIILAFGVLLAFGNTVTAFSVRYKVNFHFLLFLLASVIGLRETHSVRTLPPLNNDNSYATRPDLRAYLTAWLDDKRVLSTDTVGHDIYFVMANGGASRSGYWTAAVLGTIEDASLKKNSGSRFSDHLFCLSGTSGGGVGVATFFSLLRDKEKNVQPVYDSSAKEFLKQDYFTYTFARMLGPDFFRYIFPFSSESDRAAALERSFEDTGYVNQAPLLRVPFYDALSTFPALKNGKVYMPILCINTTRMQDGNPGVVTNLKLDSSFNNRVDVVSLLGKDSDITIATGSILGARFPYLSPAGRIANNYFVDGGYFDNSGAGVVQEMIRGILNCAKESGDSSELSKRITKLHFKVLHILNSPVDADSGNIQPVAPLKNDLASPVLTIVGAYDMQTTVNDSRLINYLHDINKHSNNKADYIQVSLYSSAVEREANPALKKELPYSMNWFISGTTRKRIDARLQQQPYLKAFIATME